MYLKYFITANCLIGTVLSFISQSSHPLVHNSRSQAVQQKTFFWSHYKSEEGFPTSGGSLSLAINSNTKERKIFPGTRMGLFHGPRKRRANPKSDSMKKTEILSTKSFLTNLQKMQKSFDVEEVFLDPIFRIPVVKMPSKDKSNSKLKIDPPKLDENKNEGEVQNIQKRIGTEPGIHSWRPLLTSDNLYSKNREQPSTSIVDRLSPINLYVQPSAIDKWTTTLFEYYRQVLFKNSYHLKYLVSVN
jgi:hypothetical protein